MVEDTWKMFELSGKISDYLLYRQQMAADSSRKVHEQMSWQENRGTGNYGTEHSSDRNDSKCHADWRV